MKLLINETYTICDDMIGIYLKQNFVLFRNIQHLCYMAWLNCTIYRTRNNVIMVTEYTMGTKLNKNNALAYDAWKMYKRSMVCVRIRSRIDNYVAARWKSKELVKRWNKKSNKEWFKIKLLKPCHLSVPRKINRRSSPIHNFCKCSVTSLNTWFINEY